MCSTKDVCRDSVWYLSLAPSAQPRSNSHTRQWRPTTSHFLFASPCLLRWSRHWDSSPYVFSLNASFLWHLCTKSHRSQSLQCNNTCAALLRKKVKIRFILSLMLPVWGTEGSLKDYVRAFGDLWYNSRLSMGFLPTLSCCLQIIINWKYWMPEYPISRVPDTAMTDVWSFTSQSE